MLVDAARADLSMYRLHAVFVCVYVVFGTILVAVSVAQSMISCGLRSRAPQGSIGAGQRENIEAMFE